MLKVSPAQENPMCNANNHPPECDCGFGGDTGSGFGSFVTVPHLPPARPGPPSTSPIRPTMWGFPPDWDGPRTYPTTCRYCGADIFYHTEGYGDSVFFDDLGPPWEEKKHACYYGRDGRGGGLRLTPHTPEPAKSAWPPSNAEIPPAYPPPLANYQQRIRDVLPCELPEGRWSGFGIIEEITCYVKRADGLFTEDPAAWNSCTGGKDPCWVYLSLVDGALRRHVIRTDTLLPEARPGALVEVDTVPFQGADEVLQLTRLVIAKPPGTG